MTRYTMITDTLLLSEDFISPAFTTAYPISMIANNFAISSINNKLISISSLSSPS